MGINKSGYKRCDGVCYLGLATVGSGQAPPKYFEVHDWRSNQDIVQVGDASVTFFCIV